MSETGENGPKKAQKRYDFLMPPEEVEMPPKRSEQITVSKETVDNLDRLIVMYAEGIKQSVTRGDMIDMLMATFLSMAVESLEEQARMN